VLTDDHVTLSDSTVICEYLDDLILPRFGGHRDYAANAATCAFNSNSMGLM